MYPLVFLLFVFTCRGEEWNHQDLPAILKDVRPRPVDPHVEGSGAPVDWSDDEDIGIEGSASGFDTIVHDTNPVSGATVKEETTTIPVPSRLHKPTQKQDTASPEDTIDHVIETDAGGNTPDSSSKMLLFSIFILVLTRHLLL